MRIKILNHQKEKEINKELKLLEKSRNISNVKFFSKKTAILHYPENKELEREISIIRNKLHKINQRQDLK